MERLINRGQNTDILVFFGAILGELFYKVMISFIA